MRTLNLALLTLSLAFTSSAARADVDSGPAADSGVPALKVDWLDGEQFTAKDWAKERGERPTIYVFVQAAEWSRPMARFVKALDEAAGKVGEAAVVAVWIGGDVDGAKQYVPRGRGALRLSSTEYAVYAGEGNDPADWALNDRASLTAVVANGGKVVRSFGYVSINESDAPEVAKVLTEAAK